MPRGSMYGAPPRGQCPSAKHFPQSISPVNSSIFQPCGVVPVGTIRQRDLQEMNVPKKAAPGTTENLRFQIASEPPELETPIEIGTGTGIGMVEIKTVNGIESVEKNTSIGTLTEIAIEPETETETGTASPETPIAQSEILLMSGIEISFPLSWRVAGSE
ncbi:hypothetical protein PtA15_10A634 [Puccinia triticina]|uniref:Lipoyl-binding domain-containing protein n=1 Tax=Puccinia triticina TaxID=208348 RepID=A0ABY7CZJ5_9BASI|nr:uncharacterized protein PtA15_10A634 [Puccinia triticina]WAQ89210.1 hypothetical protein PtA15_10A634 [Puccinia triticina]